MPIVRAFGTLVPTGIIADAEFPLCSLIHPELGQTILGAKIVGGIPEVKCQIEHYQDNFIPAIHRHASETLRAFVDVFSFGTGTGIIAMLYIFVLPNGEQRHFFNSVGFLARECTAFKVRGKVEVDDQEVRSVASLILGDASLLMALNDLTLTLSFPTLAPAHCRRVLDSLRKIVYPSRNVAQGWEELRKRINVNEHYMRWVMDQAHDPTHGDRSYIPAETIQEMLRRTWVVMNRFIEFKKRGYEPLSVEEFPEVVS